MSHHVFRHIKQLCHSHCELKLIMKNIVLCRDAIQWIIIIIISNK